jgi:hypothetical protein
MSVWELPFHSRNLQNTALAKSCAVNAASRLFTKLTGLRVLDPPFKKRRFGMNARATVSLSCSSSAEQRLIKEHLSH